MNTTQKVTGLTDSKRIVIAFMVWVITTWLLYLFFGASKIAEHMVFGLAATISIPLLTVPIFLYQLIKAPVDIDRDLRVELETAKAQITDIEHKEKATNELIKLYVKGNELYNINCNFETWLSKMQIWEKEVENVIKQHFPTIAMHNFIARKPTIWPSYLNRDVAWAKTQEATLRHYYVRLESLNYLIQDYVHQHHS